MRSGCRTSRSQQACRSVRGRRCRQAVAVLVAIACALVNTGRVLKRASRNTSLNGAERQTILKEVAQLRMYADAKRWINSPGLKPGAEQLLSTCAIDDLSPFHSRCPPATERPVRSHPTSGSAACKPTATSRLSDLHPAPSAGALSFPAPASPIRLRTSISRFARARPAMT